MRKHILAPIPDLGARTPGELNIPACATVLVTSEMAAHPIENAFDGRRGPGATRWMAETPGEQTLILAFDVPQTFRTVLLEIEETKEARTQELHLAVSCNGGQTYRELVRQEFNFSPSGSTFEHEEWTVEVEAVTHLRLELKPDKSGRFGRASLTALGLR